MPTTRPVRYQKSCVTETTAKGTFWGRRVAVGLVLLIALVVRVDHAVREPAVNPDVIRFIHQAQELGPNPVRALQREVYHPLHSALIAAVHPVMQTFVADDRMAWIAAAKFVGIISAVVVTWLIVAFSRHFGAPWWAACGAGFLWAVGRRTSSYGADGMSDMLFLAMFGGAILVAMRSRFKPRLTHWLLAGLLAGLAYLARPEGVAAVLILAFSLLAYYARWHPLGWFHRLGPRLGKLRWGDCSKSLAALLVGFALIGTPYMIIIGNFTGKKPLVLVNELGAARLPAPLPATGVVTPLPAGSGTASVGILFERTPWELLGREFWETFGFAPWIVVGLALIMKPRPWGRAHWRTLVAIWFDLWFLTMLWLIYRTKSMGDVYLDGRHTLVVQLVLHALFALALPIWAKPMVWWQGWWRKRETWARLPAWMRSPKWPPVAVGTTFVLGCLPGLISLAEPPRADRRFVREAANWLATNGEPDAVVLCNDPLLAYYSGLKERAWGGGPEDKLAADEKVVVAYTFRPGRGEQVVERIGAYEKVKAFQAVGAHYDDVLVLYVTPGTKAVREEVPKDLRH